MIEWGLVEFEMPPRSRFSRVSLAPNSERSERKALASHRLVPRLRRSPLAPISERSEMIEKIEWGLVEFEMPP